MNKNPLSNNEIEGLPWEKPARKDYPWPHKTDLELLGWLLAGIVTGIALKVTTASAIIITVVVVGAVVRLYYEKPDKNPRSSIGMAPLFLVGWVIGLLIRALVS